MGKYRYAAARETEAEAAAARAEAERRQAQADRLEAEAADRHRAATDVRDEHQGRLQQADELDPDVNTKSKDYTGPDTAATINARAAERDDHHDDGQPAQRIDDLGAPGGLGQHRGRRFGDAVSAFVGRVNFVDVLDANLGHEEREVSVRRGRGSTGSC